ncbi:Protein kinase, ATP binding site-containing protein [Cynara cardunculus var. scolymus]|uniref:Protein kinase, ATP binding site-containing protein n=1 Tax=Cynara cardunculus var. scolymus TaxID=59895 RepID=A0A103Y4R5_CYNCS|nr:Protein kinase, ATP binding site-containing protein [Cynara cardunculus var. scolymus]
MGLDKKKEDEIEIRGCWIKFSFLGRCISTRSKVESSICGSSIPYAESKSTNDTSLDQPVVLAASSSNGESTPSTPNVTEELNIASQLRKFNFNELKSATRSFRPESLLGEGGFGCVFKGWINENGTMPVKPGTGSLPLPWETRMKIALGAAKGLAFLHEEAERPVIYRDFKTSNILLDVDYNVKLSDFGLAKDGPEGDNTHMITGRRSMDKNRPNGEHNLVEWARPHLGERRRFYHLIDPLLEGRFSVRGAQKAAQLATLCLNRDPKARPLMSDVYEALMPLVNLKDMACSSAYFQAMQAERSTPNQSSRNGRSMRSLSIPSYPYVSPHRNDGPYRSPKPVR